MQAALFFSPLKTRAFPPNAQPGRQRHSTVVSETTG